MADADEIPRTILQKLLFYTTATFVLLGTFSLFAFLFLVPFVIDPAFTTIFMQFDPRPAFCVTSDVRRLFGASNCTWASCREGCTKDVYDCTQIRVNYKVAAGEDDPAETKEMSRVARAIRDYDYGPYEPAVEHREALIYPDPPVPTGLQGNDSEWYFTGAKFFPNVKGCGYPPFLNCTIFYNKYRALGTNYSCYYSRIDPGLVISDLDMWQNTLNLVYAMAIPIPSFIVSVIYLTFAYFKIYAQEEEAEQAPLQGDAEAMAEAEDNEGGVVLAADILIGTPGSDTFREDLASYHNRDQRSPAISNSASIPGSSSAPVQLVGLHYSFPKKFSSLSNKIKLEDIKDMTFRKCMLSRKLEQDDDDQYFDSTWADSSSMKRQFHGMKDISWKPK